MNHEDQVGKNFAWGAFSQIITRLFGLAFFVLMSYILLEKGMGQYNFIISFAAFWFIFSDFGITGYIYREWSKGDKTPEDIKSDFNLSLTLKLLVPLIIFIPFCIVNWHINHNIFGASILYYISVFLSVIISHADIYFNSSNNFKPGAIRLLIEKSVVIILGGILLLLFDNVESIFIAMIVSQLVAIAYYFSGRFPFIPKLAFDSVRIKVLITKGLPFVLLGVITTIYGRIDMVMLKFMQNFESVGWYGAGYKAYDLANIFSGALFYPAIFPILSRIYNLGVRDKYKDFFNRALRIMFTASIFLSTFFIVFAPHLISCFFPDSFMPSVLVMRIIVLVLTASFFSILFNALLLIQNKEKMILKITITSCLVNIALNFIFIPKYSLYGAAWATVIAEMVNLFLLQYFADWDKDKKMIFKMFAVVGFTALLFVAMKVFGLSNNLLIGSMNIFAIMSLIWTIGLVNKGDLQMFYLPFKNKFKTLFFTQNEL